MRNFDVKPSIEPHDRYQKAHFKLAEAVEAIRKLTPDEQKRLTFEFFGAKSKEEIIQAVLRIMQGI